MDALQPLMTLLAQTEKERDLALAESRRRADLQRSAEAQLGQLVDYRRDYEKRWNLQFQAGGAIELVACYRGFMERLMQAVAQQERQVGFVRMQAERAVEQLREREMRVASVRKLIERRAAEMRLSADRREQKQNDEFAMRLAATRGGLAGFGSPLLV